MKLDHPTTGDSSHTLLTLRSTNKKLGPIATSITSATSCPDACPLKAAGCYAKSGPLALHWRAVTNGERGMEWDAFVSAVAAMPEGQVWRHNQAGDLAGDNGRIDAAKLRQLVSANAGKMGWTYTHKPMNTAANRKAVAHANANGFVVNLSADTLKEADQLADHGIAPVVVVLDAPEGEKADTVTPAGRKVVTCPATYKDNVTCASCLLCARGNRKVIVGFPAHGNGRKAARKVAAG